MAEIANSPAEVQRTTIRWSELPSPPGPLLLAKFLYFKFRDLSAKALGFSVLTCIGFGVGMIQLDEYLAAIGVWLVASALFVTRAVHWKGVNNRPLTLLGRLAGIGGSVIFFFFLYSYTEIKRGDKPWSILIVHKKAAPTAVLIEPQKSEPTKPEPEEKPTVPEKPKLKAPTLSAKSSKPKEEKIPEPISVAFRYNNNKQEIEMYNMRETELRIWGYQIDDTPTVMHENPRVVAPKPFFYYMRVKGLDDTLLKEASNDGKKTVIIYFLIKDTTDQELTLKCQLTAIMVDSRITIHAVNVGVEPGWR